MKMAKSNSDLPKYYKGYDIDKLWKKNWKSKLTEDESKIMSEMFEIYIRPVEEKRNKELDEIIEKAENEKRIIGVVSINPGHLELLRERC